LRISTILLQFNPIRCQGQDERERHLDELKEAKRLILDKYNIFPMLADLLDELPQGTESKKITMKPENIIYTRSLKDLGLGIGGELKAWLKRG